MERIKRVLAFTGRSTRLTYWRTQIGLTVGIGVVMLATILASGWGQAAAAIAFLPMLLLVAASLAVVVRRLHDRGKSGFWALLFVGLPALAGLAAGAGGDGSAGPLALVGLGLSLWGLVEIGFLRGTPGENQYGLPPAR